jgi:hypothetical protein
MLSMLIAYDAAGNVVGTLDYLVARDENEIAIGLVDFSAHMTRGGKLRDVWEVSNAVGSDTWPEWIGGRAHDFRVELTGKKISALVHKQSGHRRERHEIEQAIADVQPDEQGTKDLRAVVGGPMRPIPLDDQGQRYQPRGGNLHLVDLANT